MFGLDMRSLLILVCVTGVILFAACRNAQPDRYAQSPKFGSCINALRMIDGAKQQLAHETGASTNAVPTFKDIRPYLVGRGRDGDLAWFRCPAGGTYTIDWLDVPPTCSLAGRATYYHEPEPAGSNEPRHSASFSCRVSRARGRCC